MNWTSNFGVFFTTDFVPNVPLCATSFPLGAVHNRRPHKFAKTGPTSLSALAQPSLSVRTHHVLRKIWCFCNKKFGRPHLKNPLVHKCPHWTNPPWLRTSFMDIPLGLALHDAKPFLRLPWKTSWPYVTARRVFQERNTWQNLRPGPVLRWVHFPEVPMV